MTSLDSSMTKKPGQSNQKRRSLTNVWLVSSSITLNKSFWTTKRYLKKYFEKVPSWHLLVESKQSKHQINVWNISKVKNKDKSTTSFYRWLWIYLIQCSCVSLDEFEHDASRELALFLKKYKRFAIYFVFKRFKSACFLSVN